MKFFSKHINLFLTLALVMLASIALGQIRERPGQLPPGGPPNDGGFGSFPGNNPFPTDTTQQRTDSTGRIIFENTDTINFRRVVREYDLNLERYEPAFSLDNVHLYQEMDEFEEPVHNLGVNGSPIFQLTTIQQYEPGVQTGMKFYDAYKIQDDEVKYYRAERPFTKMFYATGSERENRFKLAHTQNFGRGLNVGFDYQRLVHEGFYNRQQIDHNNVALHAWYQGKNKHFNSMVHYISNKFANEENGGIQDTSVDYFENEDFDRRLGIPINLASARSRFNGRSFNIQNAYDFGQSLNVQINDTISDKQLVPRFRVQHTLNIKQDDSFYRSDSNDDSFFAEARFSEFSTADSLFFNKLSNEVRLKWLGFKLAEDSTLQRQNFLADAYARFEAYDVEMDGNFANGSIFTDNFTDLAVGGSFRSNPVDTAKFLYKAEAAFHLADYRLGDYYGRGEIGYDLQNIAGKLSGFVELSNQEPYYTHQRLESNHYSIQQDLDKINARTIGGQYENERLGFTGGVRFLNITNAVWFDGQSAAQQSSGAESYVLVNASRNFTLGKFNANLSGWYQTTSDENAMGLPTFIGSGDIFFKGGLFKNKVYSKIGFNARYLSAFNFDIYDPALGQFLVQNETTYDSYPELNFYTNFSLSRARLFLRLDNIPSLLLTDPNFRGFERAQHDFAFRTGINWVFVN